MFTAFIAFVMLIIGMVTGYALRPKIDRKISYKKRGRATKVRAAAKRAAKVPVKVQKDNYVNGSTTYSN